ncbi:hypothetical protein LTS10_000934 [Elasticomyces elasticus]|nr:hypothetical protein LTS10_000934 [Elasticomyces elasticus]
MTDPTRKGRLAYREFTGLNAKRYTVQPPQIIPHRMAHAQYTGYEHLLQELEWHIPLTKPRQDYQTKFVLVGMGGIGKSEMVLQLIKKNRSTLDDRQWAVLWVDCSSTTTARADFKRISTQYEWAVMDSNIIVDVRDRLARLTTTALLVLDNCDDESVNYGAYIPDNLLVTVLLTTRLRAARKFASHDPQDPSKEHFMHLDGLDPGSATDLLMKVSATAQNDGQINAVAGNIVASLGFHPLAINVAGSAIHESIFSFEEYASALRGQLMGEDSLAQKVNVTFNVSARALAASTDKSAQDALRLLDVLAFVHHQGVSEDIFERAWKYEDTILSWFKEYEVDLFSWYDDHDEDVDGDKAITVLSPWHVANCRQFLGSHPPGRRMHAFRIARAHLVRLSLITVDAVTQSISLHLLISAWAKERLAHPYEAWLCAACVLVLSTQKTGAWESFSSRLYPHIETNFSTFTNMPLWQAAVRYRRQLCRIWHTYTGQLYLASSPLTIECLQRLVKQALALSDAGPAEGGLVEAQYLMGLVYMDNGQSGKALGPLRRVARLRQGLAEDDPNHLATQHALAEAYHNNGQVSQGVKLLEHVVRVEGQKLAEAHRGRLASQHELAYAYLADGQVTRAVELLEHVVQVEGKKLAEDHPKRLASQHQLAVAYLEDGQVAQAVELLEHVVRVREKVLAEDHPHRLVSQHEVARAYWSSDRYQEALDLIQHVVSVQSRTLSVDDPNRKMSVDMLGRIREEMGELELETGTDASVNASDESVSVHEEIRDATGGAEACSQD